MRVLHLALEDHRRSGSGGGSLRNHEINSRLAASGFSLDVVVAGFPGARDRTEDGVRYRHVGLPVGYAPSLISYQMMLPWVVRAAARLGWRPDLIVEEFAPLTSSLGVGHWTDIPTLGLVQGFFAREKAQQYHMPVKALTAVERWGTRSHHRLIAVSESLRRQLLTVAPGADVAVIPNGVDLASAATGRASLQANGRRFAENYVLFLGRLEIHQKGLDRLVEAMHLLDCRVRLVVAGAGRDQRRLQSAVERAGLSNRVTFLGAVQDRDKWELIAAADALVLPSRYETFGISALEAMACGTPVIASDLQCIRELVPADAGILVPPGNVRALAHAIARVTSDASLKEGMRKAGTRTAQSYGWDALAHAQGEIYRQTIEAGRAKR